MCNNPAKTLLGASIEFVRRCARRAVKAEQPSRKLKREEVTPKDNAQICSREIKLSTTGLSNAGDGVVKSCDGAKLPEATKGDGKR